MSARPTDPLPGTPARALTAPQKALRQIVLVSDIDLSRLLPLG